MKIAVSSKGAGLGAWLEPDLAKCGFLMVVDDNFKFNAIENSGSIIDSINKAINDGFEAIVVGELEEEIVAFLKSKDIKIFTAQQGSIMELVESARDGSLAKID